MRVKLILVDCGMGNKQSENFLAIIIFMATIIWTKSSRLWVSSERYYRRVLTHLHFDHCGGAIERDGEKLVRI